MRARLLFVLFVVGCGEPSPPTRFTAQPVALAATTTTAALVDLDADGRLDLVTVGGGGVAVRPWQDGFPTANIHSLPGTAVGIAVADLDGDGRLDVAAGLPLRAAIAWLPGATDAPREILIDATVAVLAAGDIDGDEFADLVIGVQDRDELLLLRGGPHGPELVQRLTLAETSAITIADLDGDGRDEVIAAQPGGSAVQVLHTTADGQLSPGEVAWRSGFPTAVITADLDDDGAPDLAAVDPIARLLFVGLGDGAGGWRSRGVWPLDIEANTLLARRGPAGPELAVGGVDRHSLLLMDPLDGQVLVSAGLRGPNNLLVAGDLDGDGVDELVADDTVVRDATGDALRSLAAPVGPAVGLLLRADLDGDGADELVAQEPDRDELVAYAIDDAALLERARVPAPPGLTGLRAAARGDGGHDVAWWSGAAFRLLSGADLASLATTDLPGIADLVPLHLDDDGEHDLAVLTRTAGFIHGAAHTTNALLFPPLDPAAPIHEGIEVSAVVVAQLDDDPRDDLWIFDADGATVLRSGDAWAPARAGAITGLTGAAATDLDGDGTLDIVGCSATGVLAAHGLGDGVLGPGTRLSDAACTHIVTCSAGDKTATLMLDSSISRSIELLHATGGAWTSGGGLYPGLAATSLAPRCAADSLSLWTGGGRGLAPLTVVPGRALVARDPAALYPIRPQIGDLDGDGLDELIADDSPRVMIARADGVGGLAPAISFVHPTAAPPGQIVGLGEFDGDPGAELLVSEIDENGATSHALWALRDDSLVRTAAIDVASFELVGDFDGDGRDELLSRADDWPALARPGEDLQRLERARFEGLSYMRAADFDGDGRTDILANAPYPSLVLLRSEGPEFAEPRALDLAGDPGRIGVGDLDHDGALDLVLYDAFGAPPAGAYTICLRGAAGPASRCKTTPWADPGRYLVPLFIEDIDGDGDPDVVLNSFTPERTYLQLLRGDGSGRIHPQPAQPSVIGTPAHARLGGDVPTTLLLSIGQAYILAPEAP